MDDLFLFGPGIVVAMIVAVLGGLLSVVVVLKRLAFVGQGVSHAAFGGVGLAALMGLNGFGGADPVLRTATIAVFSIGAGLLVSHLAARVSRRTDAAIGIVMTGSMALGFVLYRIAAERALAAGDMPPPSIEGVLFGELLAISAMAAWTTGAAAALIAAGLFWLRRPILLWAFDEPACEPAGVSASRTGMAVLILLAATVVLAVQVAGVVLATAVLVLPGATALRLTRSLGPTIAISVLTGVVTVAGGIWLSVRLDWPPGSTIALTQCAAWLAAAVGTGWRR